MDKKPEPDIATSERMIAKSREDIIIEAKRLCENCVYTSKSHFIEAHFWQNLHLWIGIPTVILAAIIGTLTFTQHRTLAGLLSIIVVVLTSITTFLNPKERSASHLTAGNNYDALMTKTRIFHSIDCWQEESDRMLTDQLKRFCEERDRLNRECLQPFQWAYKRAKKAVEQGETKYSFEKEN